MAGADGTLLERAGAAAGPAAACREEFGTVTVDLPRSEWVAGVGRLRDGLELSFFDLLTAVDELEAGFAVVVHLWSPARRWGLLARTRCPREDAWVPTLTGLFAGAGWHERAAAELFGVRFAGHPEPAPLLLPAGFAGHPLRKEFRLPGRPDAVPEDLP